MIRPLTLADAPACHALHAICDTQTHWSTSAYEELISVHLGYGYFMPHLVGFILAQVAQTQADIVYIAVDPSLRQQGIGRLLVSQLSQQQALEEIFLEVNENNKMALSFYFCIDFISIGRRKGYYTRDGISYDAIILKKTFLPC